MSEAAFWSAQIAGGLIAILGFVAFLRSHAAVDWVRAVLGTWIARSPLVLVSGFTSDLTAVHVLIGLAALGYPAWRMWLENGGNLPMTA